MKKTKNFFFHGQVASVCDVYFQPRRNTKNDFNSIYVCLTIATGRKCVCSNHWTEFFSEISCVRFVKIISTITITKDWVKMSLDNDKRSSDMKFVSIFMKTYKNQIIRFKECFKRMKTSTSDTNWWSSKCSCELNSACENTMSIPISSNSLQLTSIISFVIENKYSIIKNDVSLND